MKWLDGYRLKLMLIGVVAAIMLGGESARADFTFGTQTNLGPLINSNSCDDGLTISSDGLSIIFSSDRPHMGDWDLYMATRETTDDEWGSAVNLGSTVNGPYSQSYPSISADGLELFFTSPFWQSEWTEFGGADLWVSKRSSVSDAWSAPENLGSLVNTSSHDTEPSISADGLELYFSSTRPGGYSQWNIWVTKRRTKDDPWQEAVNLGPIVNLGNAYTANISANGLVLLFASTRSGGYGQGDIWMTRRKTKHHQWEEPVNLGFPISDYGRQWAPCISHDGSTLYFMDWDKGPQYGYFDIWQAPILPIVDFNGDGIVNVRDVVILTDHWGENYSLCDIGPMPFGDGIVDVRDLIVLAEYVEPEVRDPALIAYWKLDEKEGTIAYDSAGTNDAVTFGDPIWQPTGGMVDGAIQLDGVDDCVITGSILNPTEGPFSVFTWVKGGAPGQAVLSQMGGARWVCADPSDGNLMTELKGTGRGAAELLSQTVITDGNWHRIGLVWDGSHRTLYVDDVAVADDTQDNLKASENGLYIGTGKAMEPGSFWSGLIDDVRIYNRAVTP